MFKRQLQISYARYNLQTYFFVKIIKEHCDNIIIYGSALLLNVCNQLILYKKIFKDVIFIRIVTLFSIQSKIQDFSILINNCFCNWCKSHNLNDKNVSNIYFMAILVRVIIIHIGNVINRPLLQKYPYVQSANKLYYTPRKLCL